MQSKYLDPQKKICTQAIELYIWDSSCSKTCVFKLGTVAQTHMSLGIRAQPAHTGTQQVTFMFIHIPSYK